MFQELVSDVSPTSTGIAPMRDVGSVMVGRTAWWVLV